MAGLASLKVREPRFSPNREFALVLLRSGDLTLKNITSGQVGFVSLFRDTKPPGYASHLELCEDGNLVLHSAEGSVATAWPAANPSNYDLRVDDKGMVYLYDSKAAQLTRILFTPVLSGLPSGVHWRPGPIQAPGILRPGEGITSANHNHGLYLDLDGTLWHVELLKDSGSGPNSIIFVDATTRRPFEKPGQIASRLVLNGDGNIEINFIDVVQTYGTDAASHFVEHPFELHVNNDGSVRVYDQGGRFHLELRDPRGLWQGRWQEVISTHDFLAPGESLRSSPTGRYRFRYMDDGKAFLLEELGLEGSRYSVAELIQKDELVKSPDTQGGRLLGLNDEGDLAWASGPRGREPPKHEFRVDDDGGLRIHDAEGKVLLQIRAPPRRW